MNIYSKLSKKNKKNIFLNLLNFTIFSSDTDILLYENDDYNKYYDDTIVTYNSKFDYDFFEDDTIYYL